MNYKLISITLFALSNSCVATNLINKGNDTATDIASINNLPDTATLQSMTSAAKAAAPANQAFLVEAMKNYQSSFTYSKLRLCVKGVRESKQVPLLTSMYYYDMVGCKDGPVGKCGKSCKSWEEERYKVWVQKKPDVKALLITVRKGNM